MAEFLGMELDGYHHMLLETKGSGLISIEDLLEGDLGEQRTAFGSEVDPHELCSTRQLRGKVMESLKQLTEKEQLVLQLYYYEELTMKEIGMILEVTESRVCQIHSKALKKLKAHLQDKV